MDNKIITNFDKQVVIIGAGPAGLTAAYELLKRTKIKPIILEMSSDIGGISKTVNCNGYRIDLGGHRFFSKSDRVMNWWQKILPIQGYPSIDDLELERDLAFSALPGAPDPEKRDKVMLVRERISHIMFINKFFEYPLSLNFRTLYNLGLFRVIKIFISYLTYHISPIKPEVNLEIFFINRFGKELYKSFFKSYTEKLWGVACTEISADWGAQRIKSLSISKAIIHSIKSIFRKNFDVNQKNVETSLIERFYYPKYGPGQMWEEVARKIEQMGGVILLNKKVEKIKVINNRVESVTLKDQIDHTTDTLGVEYVFSSMPVRNLIAAIYSDGSSPVPQVINDISKELVYRDFLTVGMLVNRLSDNMKKFKTQGRMIGDTWIYVQEPGVKICRVQFFNNWSPYLLKDRSKVWIGLEYIIDKKDELWNMSDDEIVAYAKDEVERIDLVDRNEISFTCVIKMEKAYPAYFGSYSQFDQIRKFTDKIENLFLVGRNGMHRYNNQDHSMLTAMAAVDNIVSGSKDKENIWGVNAEAEYHEKR